MKMYIKGKLYSHSGVSEIYERFEDIAKFWYFMDFEK